MTRFKNPGSTVDLIVLSKEKILLIQRKIEPFKNKWALPGGFLEYGEECLEDAAKRELEEETNLEAESLELIGVYSNPERDPRGHVISHVFVVKNFKGKPLAGDDAKEAKWFSLLKLPRLAFDHNKILKDFLGGKNEI